MFSDLPTIDSRRPIASLPVSWLCVQEQNVVPSTLSDSSDSLSSTLVRWHPGRPDREANRIPGLCVVIAGSEFGVIAEAAVSSTGLIAEASLVDIGSYTLILASTIITES